MSNVAFHVPFTKHKHCELESCTRESERTDYSFHFKVTTKDDHAGARLSVYFWRWSFHASMYDDRHWDYDNDSWER